MTKKNDPLTAAKKAILDLNLSLDELYKLNSWVVTELRMQRKLESSRVASMMEKGTRVRLSKTLRPKWMGGLVGEVTGVKKTKLAVRVDPQENPEIISKAGLHPFIINVPATAVEEV